MEQKILLVGFCLFSVILFNFSCTSEPDNIAISPDGVRIHFEVRGEGEPAIVFLHGWSNNKSIWDTQISHFSENHKTVAIDLAGFGESGNNRNDWTIQSFGEDVIAVMNKLRLEKAVLVGFSMGGPVAVATANKLPERVAGVVLVDALQNVELKTPPQMITYMDSVMMDLVANPTNEKLVAGGFYKKNPEEAYQRVLALLEGGAPRRGWSEALKNTLRWQNEQQITALQNLDVPITAINSGRQPTDVNAFKKYVPSFEATIIPDAGHVIMWDAPDEFNQSLETSIHSFATYSMKE